MHDWLQRVWYGGERAPWWLRSLAALYGALSSVRRNAYARGWLRAHRGGCPLIVVGNITVGGTGKTPLVIWLAGELTALGLKVAVITRGYGSEAHAGVLCVNADSCACAVGDEALLIFRRAQLPVYVCRDRLAAARAAVAAGAQVVIADDGLQHLRLARDFEIALIDAARGLGNGALLPAGPLREPPARLGSVGAVVLTGAGAYQHPGALRMQLRAAGLELIEHPLPDHQAIANQALRPADGLPVLMTEKDAVKCAAPAPANCWYLPVTAQLAADDAQALLRRILMDARLLDILACPVCKGPLRLASEPGGALLVCRADRLGFPVRDGIPVMLEEEARVLEAGDPLLER